MIRFFKINVKYIFILLAAVISAANGYAQPVAANDDYKPAVTNQQGKQYPMVNSEGRVRASIAAPQALKVQLDIGGKKYDLIKDEKGVWTGESLPQDEGFHYYQLNIDGASVPDLGNIFMVQVAGEAG